MWRGGRRRRVARRQTRLAPVHMHSIHDSVVDDEAGKANSTCNPSVVEQHTCTCACTCTNVKNALHKCKTCIALQHMHQMSHVHVHVHAHNNNMTVHAHVHAHVHGWTWTWTWTLGVGVPMGMPKRACNADRHSPCACHAQCEGMTEVNHPTFR